MKISRTKFVIVFLVSTFAFQFISNSLLGLEVRLFPADVEWLLILLSTGLLWHWCFVCFSVKQLIVKSMIFNGAEDSAIGCLGD